MSVLVNSTANTVHFRRVILSMTVNMKDDTFLEELCEQVISRTDCSADAVNFNSNTK